MRNVKGLRNFILTILLIAILSVSLVACDRGDEEVTKQLEDKGYTVTLKEKALVDDQLNFLSDKGLKWSLRGVRKTGEDIDVIFVLQFKNDGSQKPEMDKIKETYKTFKYKIDNKEIEDFTYEGVGDYIYFGTKRGLRAANILNLDEYNLRDDNLFYQGYETHNDHQILSVNVKWLDSQIALESINNVDWYTQGKRINDKGKDVVFIIKYDDDTIATNAFNVYKEIKTYHLNGEDVNIKAEKDGVKIYIGTENGIQNAKNYL